MQEVLVLVEIDLRGDLRMLTETLNEVQIGNLIVEGVNETFHIST